jgi:hypothetical protein
MHNSIAYHPPLAKLHLFFLFITFHSGLCDTVQIPHARLSDSPSTTATGALIFSLQFLDNAQFL